MISSGQHKQQAHDRWACFTCRWSVKIPLIDVRAADRPSYKCPTCRRRMTSTGNAFRPPRREDDEGWIVAERLIQAGHRFYSTSERQSMPRKRRDLEQWLAAHASEPGWLPERPLVPGADGVLRSGRRIVRDREVVLVLIAGHWKQGSVRLLGDGARRLSSPVIALSPQRFLEIDADTRVRLKRRS